MLIEGRRRDTFRENRMNEGIRTYEAIESLHGFFNFCS